MFERRRLRAVDMYTEWDDMTMLTGVRYTSINLSGGVGVLKSWETTNVKLLIEVTIKPDDSIAI